MSNRLWPSRISLIRTWKAVFHQEIRLPVTFKCDPITSGTSRSVIWCFSISRCRTSGELCGSIDRSPTWLLLQGGGYTPRSSPFVSSIRILFLFRILRGKFKKRGMELWKIIPPYFCIFNNKFYYSNNSINSIISKFNFWTNLISTLLGIFKEGKQSQSFQFKVIYQ